VPSNAEDTIDPISSLVVTAAGETKVPLLLTNPIADVSVPVELAIKKLTNGAAGLTVSVRKVTAGELTNIDGLTIDPDDSIMVNVPFKVYAEVKDPDILEKLEYFGEVNFYSF
jgi:hypothetical protein